MSGPGSSRGTRPIARVAADLGLGEDTIVPFGSGLAKVPVPVVLASERAAQRPAKVVLVTSLTPTPHGEGKTVTSIGLSMGLRTVGARSCVCLRGPALGPTLGLKGGGAGGGQAQVEPASLLNLGFPGDTASVGAAHNLLSALIDNRLHFDLEPHLDPASVVWPRTVDMDDRALRQVEVGRGGKGEGPTRGDRYVITAASEVMAILGLSADYPDLKARLGRILVGWSTSKRPVPAADLKATGAMAALLKDALAPNLVQTSEGTPALVHTGPFANIAHGTASLISLRLARACSDVCVVEGGFGSDLGAEKFVDLVTTLGHVTVDAAVVVVSLPALRHHGGAAPEQVRSPSLEAVERGLPNLEKHLENVRLLGLTGVVALNRFPGDSDEEIARVGRFCEGQGVTWAQSWAFARGGEGATDLAQRVLEALQKGSTCRPLYARQDAPEVKLETIARKIYGAEGIDLAPEAVADLAQIRELGCESLPVCVAKTPLSLSDDATRPGRPKGFRVRVRRLVPSLGAGFLVAHTGNVSLMPGLPKVPAAESIDLSDDGVILGVR